MTAHSKREVLICETPRRRGIFSELTVRLNLCLQSAQESSAYFFGSLISHNRTLWSAPADAMRVPCANRATACTQAVCPSSDLSAWPLVGFHRRTVRSRLPEIST